MRRRKRRLEKRFKRTSSEKDFQTFKVHLRLYVRELRKSKSSFFFKTLSKSNSDSNTAFKTVNSPLKRGKNSPFQAAPTHTYSSSRSFFYKIEKIGASFTPHCNLVRTEVQSSP